MWTIFAIAHFALAVFFTGRVLLQDKQPITVAMWIFFMLAIPVIGVLAYLSFGTDRLRLREMRQRNEFTPLADGTNGFELPEGAQTTPQPGANQLWQALAVINSLPATRGNACELLLEAQTYYDRLCIDIDAATECVWIIVYTFRNDEVGQRILRHLIEACKRGVQVCLLLDDVGSFDNADSNFEPFVAAGGKYSSTITMHPHRNRWFLNLRNHRKIALIDGRIAYTGGMNIGMEYVQPTWTESWSDAHLRLQGPVCVHLAGVFANDWHFATDEELHLPHAAEPIPDERSIQVIVGTPAQLRSTASLSILCLIGAAERDLLITTPYFAPDEPTLIALELAAARGVRVRLLVSRVSDMGKLMPILAHTYFPRLIKAGVEVYEYAIGMHHSKCVIVDEEYCEIGSINMDHRSLHLNYEIAVVIHAKELSQRVIGVMCERLGHNKPLRHEEVVAQSTSHRLLRGIFRLLAPLT